MALAGWVLSRERSWLWACARGPGQTAGSHHCALPGLAAPGASWPGCLAAPHNRYHPATTPVARPGDPAGGGGASGAVTPNRFAFGVSGPVSPSPPAVWLSATPPPTPRNVAAPETTSKPLMTSSRSPSRTLEQPPTITSHPVIGQDKTKSGEPKGLCDPTDFGFSILDFGFPSGVGFWILDSGFWIPRQADQLGIADCRLRGWRRGQSAIQNPQSEIRNRTGGPPRYRNGPPGKTSVPGERAAQSTIRNQKSPIPRLPGTRPPRCLLRRRRGLLRRRSHRGPVRPLPRRLRRTRPRRSSRASC